MRPLSDLNLPVIQTPRASSYQPPCSVFHAYCSQRRPRYSLGQSRGVKPLLCEANKKPIKSLLWCSWWCRCFPTLLILCPSCLFLIQTGWVMVDCSCWTDGNPTRFCLFSPCEDRHQEAVRNISRCPSPHMVSTALVWDLPSFWRQFNALGHNMANKLYRPADQTLCSLS